MVKKKNAVVVNPNGEFRSRSIDVESIESWVRRDMAELLKLEQLKHNGEIVVSFSCGNGIFEKAVSSKEDFVGARENSEGERV